MHGVEYKDILGTQQKHKNYHKIIYVALSITYISGRDLVVGRGRWTSPREGEIKSKLEYENMNFFIIHLSQCYTYMLITMRNRRHTHKFHTFPPKRYEKNSFSFFIHKNFGTVDLCFHNRSFHSIFHIHLLLWVYLNEIPFMLFSSFDKCLLWSGQGKKRPS